MRYRVRLIDWISGYERGMNTDQTISELAGLLAETSDSSLIQDLLNGMLTPPEREKISLRWQLVCLLKDGMSQRAIAEKLGVSLCKITR